jgi:hypothetical protein
MSVCDATAPTSAPISRRLFVLGVAAAPVLTAFPAMAAVPASGHLLFHAYREGNHIGEHRLAFTTAGGAVTVQTQVDLAIKVGPLTVFRYAHHATEHWRDGRFESLDTHTEATAGSDRVSAHRTDGGVLIVSSKASKITASATAAPLTHWNMEAVKPPLFNPQTGKIVRASVARGHDAKGSKLTLSGEVSLTDWYDASGVWTALRGKAADGSMLEYRRV